MATRFYLPSSGTAGASPAYGPAWDNTSVAARYPAVTTKSSTSMAFISKNGDTDTTDSDHLYGQWVSAPLAAQTIAAQALELQIRAMEENARADQFVAIHIRAVSNDGSTVRGTVLALSRDNTEIFASTTIAVNRRFTATTSALDVSANDRLVIEIGTGGNPQTGAGGDSHDADLRVGDASASDLPEDDSEAVNDYNPWVEFADTLSFSSGGVSGVATITLDGITSTAAGVSTIEADFAQSLDGVTLSAAGVAPIIAQASITLDDSTLSAIGTGATGAEGALSVTLDDLAIVAAGVAPVNGAASITLDDVSSTATGVSTVNGAAAVTLADVTLSSAAVSTIEAAASITLDDVTGTGAAVSTISAIAEIALDGVTLSGAGVSTIEAEAAITLDDVTLLSGTGTGISGVAAITLDNVTLSAAGVTPIDAETIATLDDLALSSAAVSTVSGAASVTLDDLIASATGTSAISGALAVTLAALTLYAIGSVPATGTGNRPVNYVGTRQGLTTTGPTTHHVTGRTVLSAETRCTAYVADLEVDEL